MALASPHTFTAGELLTAANLQNIETNILNNPISLISPTTGVINFNLQAHTGLIPAAISATSGSTGSILTVSAAGTAVWSSNVTFSTNQNFPADQFTSTGVIGGQVLLQTTGGRFSLGAPGGSRVRGLLGSGSSQTLSFTADQYVLQTTAGNGTFVLNTTASPSVSVGTAGPAANGRDVAGAFASTYVHYYAITTGLGSTSIAGLVSTSPPPGGPTALPTNYQAWAYIGSAIYSSASTALASVQRFRGAWTYFDAQENILNGGGATAETAVGYGAVVPSNALAIQLGILTIGQSAAAGILVENASIIRAIPGSNFHIQDQRIGAPGGNDIWTRGVIQIPVTSSQQVLYLNTVVVGTSARTTLDVLGFKNPNGGE